MSETLARGEIGQALADRGRELEAVTGTGRADHQAAAALEDERFVGRRRVEAGFRCDGVGVGEPVGFARPARDLLDQARLGLAWVVGIDLWAGVVCPDL